MHGEWATKGGWFDIPSSFQVFWKSTEVELKKQQKQQNANRNVTCRRCRNCSSSSMSWSGRNGINMACPVVPACQTTQAGDLTLLSSPAGGGTPKEGLNLAWAAAEASLHCWCWELERKHGLGLGSWPVFSAQHFPTQQTHNSLERMPRKKMIFLGLDITLKGLTSLKGT